ncbi:BMC domain-containing protein [Natronincola peptidivorans]|uniref:BMC domain-containing protein n=1 Tax=Natronincola peptidivorans TaxID=426128 RepID=A0A1I0CFD1_9FIRM|nr:BMC domain-containing protein [Natronincola peptidivorans]SET18276.1 BMC domain-containing protein [Natronincola peptidivorans]
MYAVGFLEIQGLTAAIEALDRMLKTSDVELVTWEKKLGGRLVTMIIKGSVSAVQEAIDHGTRDTLYPVAAHGVIANPHEETIKMIEKSAQKQQIEKW